MASAAINTDTSNPATFKLLAAGTYDLVAIDPNTSDKRCARKIVALAADTWTLTDSAGNVTGPFAVPSGFPHLGQTQAIVSATGPIAVYW